MIDDHFRAVSRNRALQAQLEQAVPELVRARTLKRENARLKALLDLSEPNPRMIASAPIVGGSPSLPSSTALLSAGTRPGVAVGPPVRVTAGRVRRGHEPGSHPAREEG